MNIALVGVGGYGEIYVDALLGTQAAMEQVRMVAGIDPRPNQSKHFDALLDRAVPLFASLTEMHSAGIRPDLVILATPLHLHADQAVLAMEHGSHVLCEKPLAATSEDANRMIAASSQSGRNLAVGFQWAYAPGVARLKSDVSAGRFGRPLSLRTKVYWPRNLNYYARNTWAGRIRTPDGRTVLDSPVNNACSHFIHSMLDVVIDAWDSTDGPATVEAEMYRANDIENYDTAVIRCHTRSGIQLLAAVSHATEHAMEPVFEYTFEGGRVICDGAEDGDIIGQFNDGAETNYGPVPQGNDTQKVWSTIKALRNGENCRYALASAHAHTILVEAVQKAAAVTTFAPDSIAERIDKPGLFVPGLTDVLDRCYAHGQLPFELGIPWSKAGGRIEIEPTHGQHAATRNHKRNSVHAMAVSVSDAVQHFAQQAAAL